MSAARLRDPAGVAGARPLEDGGRGPDEQCGHVTSSPPITAHLEGVQIDVVQQQGHSPGLCRRSKHFNIFGTNILM